MLVLLEYLFSMAGAHEKITRTDQKQTHELVYIQFYIILRFTFVYSFNTLSRIRKEFKYKMYSLNELIQ